jgi:acetyl-CoA acetyltransferase family protein
VALLPHLSLLDDKDVAAEEREQARVAGHWVLAGIPATLAEDSLAVSTLGASAVAAPLPPSPPAALPPVHKELEGDTVEVVMPLKPGVHDALARLKGVVRPDGSVTAGTASGVNDGSCALLLAGEAEVAKYGLAPKARVVGMATAGVAPRIMGIGPAPATEKVLALTGLTLAQMDVIELNEAFAAQGIAVLRMLGLKDDDERVNAWGGAIALGHPLGASGARLATTAVNRLHATGGRYALCTMCIGVGQGIAVILERV